MAGLYPASFGFNKTPTNLKTGIEKDHLLGAITHLFLPKKTPDKAEGCLEDIEHSILHSVSRSVSDAIEQSPFSELAIIGKMLTNWELLQPKARNQKEEDKFVKDYVALTTPNLTPAMSVIPIYIRQQNSTLLIENQDDGSVRVETFRASLPSEVIMGNVRPLSMEFPERSEVIQNKDLLSSQVFARNLYQLSTYEFNISLPQEPGKESSKNEVSEPFLINDMIVAVLSPTPKQREKYSVCKKIRDQVTGMTGPTNLNPFRRSGLWMSVKVALQLKLLKLFQNDTNMSKIVYKLLMLRVLGDICRDYYKKHRNHIDLDLVTQMLAKVGRRAYKLTKLPSPARGRNQEDFTRAMKIEDLKVNILEHVKGITSKLQESMKQCQYKMTDCGGTVGLAGTLQNHTTSDYLRDLDHSIPFLSSYKEAPYPPGNQSPSINNTEELRQSLELKRYETLDAILAAGRSLGDKTITLKERIWLHDTESFMKSRLEMESDTEKIKDLMQTYMTNALKLYKSNPIGISQLVLVVLKSVEALDRKAAQTHPFILEYQLGIDCSAFDCLLLPHKYDMKLLEKALDYFQNRDRMALVKEGILSLGGIHKNSFAVRFASQNSQMIQLRNEVLRKTEANIAQRFADIKIAKVECSEILTKFENYQKEAEMGFRTFPQFLEVTYPLEHQLIKIRTQFPRFEKPLPTHEYLQNAVIFEMIIPKEVSNLRDSLAILKFDLLEESTVKKTRKVYWKSYQNLMNYLPYGSRSPRNTAIILGSNRLSFSETFDEKRNPDIMCCTDKMLIWENALECLYSYSHSTYSFSQPMKDLKIACAFQINQTENFGPYLTLQGYLQSYHHFQNDVIANQHACHDNLPLDEFVTFGSLRAGHRIQIRNMYRAISSKQLSLEEEPVLALILQAIWQLGPCEEGTWRREAHIDFEDEEFSSAMLDVVESVAKANATNYSHPLVLLVAISITLRIFELNEMLHERCYTLLRSWRSIMKGWTAKIEEGMLDESNPHTLRELQKTLLLVRICSAFSYSFSSSVKWDRVMKVEEDITEWFHTISILNQQEAARETTSTFRLSGFMQILLNFVKNAALRFQLEKDVISHPFLSQSFRLFVSEKWSKAIHCIEPSLRHLGQENLVSLNYTEKQSSRVGQDVQSYIITFDLIMGTFLVNGYPKDSLPTDITKGPYFQRFFQQSATFRVQKESPVIFRTVGKFHGKHYEFRTLGQKPLLQGGSFMDVIIKEILDDGAVLTLIEHENLKGALAGHFVEKYTHWLDSHKNILYLRRVPSQDLDYDLPHEFKLVKESNGRWQLYNEGNHCSVISNKSAGFVNVTKALKGLEMSRNINVMMNKDTEVVSAHLPRYNLQFLVTEKGLECVQFPGFHLIVPGLLSKQVDTLVGLQQGFQLKRKGRRIMIIPNGTISIQKDPKWHHHQTLIALQELRQPAYFTYEFDKVLKRLVANKSKQAWLYLAALHAVTSSPLPDQFTGMTGTEMAVRILQSGFVWSSSPYDKDSMRILKFIQGLSPMRTYYGSNENRRVCKESMEVIQWPVMGLPSMSSFDGFDILVEKLLEDSERLEPLYYVDQQEKLETNNNEPKKQQRSDKLRLRGYFRHLASYNEGAAVELHYFRSYLTGNYLRENNTKISLTTTMDGKFEAGTVLQVSSIRRPSDPLPSKTVPASFKKDNLIHFLFTGYEQPKFVPPPGSLKDVLDMNFKTSWFSLYKMAIKKTKGEEKHLLSFILSVLAYKKEPIGQILNLQYISEYAEQVDFPLPPEEFLPKFDSNQIPLYDPSDQDVEAALQRIILNQFPRNISYDIRIRVKEVVTTILKGAHETSREAPEFFKSCLATLPYPGYTCSANVWSEITLLRKQWLLTGQLRRFIENVQNKLNEIYDSLHLDGNGNTPPTSDTNDRSDRSVVINVGQVEWKLNLGLDDLFETFQLDEELWTEAETYFKTGSISCFNFDHEEDQEEELSLKKKEYQNKVKDIMQNMLDMVNGTEEGKIVNLGGICPRTDPSSLLQSLIQRGESKVIGSKRGRNIAKIYAGALAVLWIHIKRLNRCLDYFRSDMIPELQRELDNPGHENWKPEEYPEWLLLELELNLMIRSVQVDVAKQMMKMPFRRNGVLQLNMGEGKTSVIVPMLCSVLGNKETFCRVTVLGPMFNMNYGILSFAIGGLLNQRVYAFPCKRDMGIDEVCVDKIQNAYKECLGMRGVVLTQPDQRLSFRLLAYDSILKKDVGLGLKLLETEDWLRKHARDVLDESDELLNVKYQLVYTVGEQLPLDGGDLRWSTCQKLLQIVHQIGGKFLDEYGSGIVELDEEEYNQNPHQFTPIRLLNSEIYPEFVSAVADHIVGEIIGTKEEKVLIKQFLTEEDLKHSDQAQALKIVKVVPELLNKILLISGYLRRGVLTLGLSKRWRVEYGVDAQKTNRKIAIPFRAKDVPAERAEFGHPDLAILLTHLSYYYSGLSNSQVDETMKLLKLRQGSDAVYDSWIQQIPNDQLPEFLSTYRGLNMKDTLQKSKLFELLKRHKLVIDFWLSQKVFPREAKQFPAKLVMTSWDLCYERGEHPITGFSGTNDSSVLLPLAISQQDLPSLSGTNRKVEGFLLQPENQGHRKLEMGVTCEEILKQMKEDQLGVLIDAGALMLDCDNEQVATLWMEMDVEIEAVVYFRGNELMVKCRSARGQEKEQDVPFELSSFQKRLDKCGVFLDDQHTRGTDLKFPTGSRACVTVGGRMKRDKLIQACMRMRKLGNGHSVTFYLSHEAYDQVTEVGVEGESIAIETKDVLEWVRKNTKRFNENGLLYWAIAGKNYAQRLAAEDNFHYPAVITNSQQALTVLGNQCRDEEITKLIQLYGQHSRLDLLVNALPRWFDSSMEGLKLKNNNCELPKGIQENFERICEQVIGRCQKHVPKMTHLSGLSMEEEQERELELEKEMEVEEERVVEKRKKVNPARHSLHEAVIKVVANGEAAQIKQGIMRLCDIFRDTTYCREVQPEGWGNAVFATTDFTKVISDVCVNTDQFIRPVEWFVSLGGREGSDQILLLSPFEVNELLPLFRKNGVGCRLHMFSLRRSGKENLLLNERRLLLPTGCSPTGIPEGGRSTAALLLASGNLYFKNMDEQRGFASFLCLAPRPWNEEEQKAFDKQLITKAGFMLPQFRRNYIQNGEGLECGFSKDPTPLVRTILIGKHPVLSDKAHVVQLLNEKRYLMIG